jgi:hypothetical protein
MINNYSKLSKPFHGSFGRLVGDASESTDFHSPEWTLVKNKRDKESKKISKLSSGISWKWIPKEQVNFEVAPKDYCTTYFRQELPSNMKLPKNYTKDKPQNSKGWNKPVNAIDSMPLKRT